MEEITAEYATESLIAPVELRYRPKVTVACKTDLGRVRENNEDKMEFFIPEDDASLASKGMVFVVCDGMGGHEAGQIASELACKTFIDVYLNHLGADPENAIRDAVRAGNRFILDIAHAVPSRRGMGTTLSAMILIQDSAYVGQVGDSRVYRLRGEELTQLTTDHTWVEDVVSAGMMSREDAERHQYRHVLTRAVGTEANVVCDISRHEVEVGDLFLLCSDGLLNHVPDELIREHLMNFSPSEATWRLVGRALMEGGSDNTTVMIVRIDELEEPSES
ncbi:MAG: Stp1/IreP family PP2C-type Ser/Thr phosphatase [Fimbriimonadaceae bacterium]|nr:Stp1/IreP family PP2C-type Ser/Thr phosphatase [Fimbriimonadaceae bacterium]